VIQAFGDFVAAEDAVQEALLAAAIQWPTQGFPDNPRGWLVHVVARRMTDHFRAELARRRPETVAITGGVGRRCSTAAGALQSVAPENTQSLTDPKNAPKDALSAILAARHCWKWLSVRQTYH
jgi:DNA-directed RNA polymerase specialized sigma24 family protein